MRAPSPAGLRPASRRHLQVASFTTDQAISPSPSFYTLALNESFVADTAVSAYYALTFSSSISLGWHPMMTLNVPGAGPLGTAFKVLSSSDAWASAVVGSTWGGVALTARKTACAPSSSLTSTPSASISPSPSTSASPSQTESLPPIPEVPLVYVSTLAGSEPMFADGYGTLASFSNPTGVALSADGSFALVGDTGNRAIRRINMTSKLVNTVAGSASSGYADGIGSLATFGGGGVNLGVTMDAAGSVALVADTENHLIRKIVLRTNEVTTLAGRRSTGADDGFGTLAAFNAPRGVSLSKDGSFALVVRCREVV